MEDKKAWTPPPKIEDLFSQLAGNAFSTMNRNTSGARTEKALPVGNAPLQLYSLATPNGIKVAIMLEELGVDYDAYTINIGAGDQFTSGFVEVNPNSKIPALVDKEGPDGKPINLFESGSIVLYLAEKYKKFLPSSPALRYEVMNWVFWQMGGQGPFTGQYGHFMVYAPPEKCETRDYGVSRYGMETQRLMHVLETHLKGKEYIVGNELTIADIMIFPWANQLRTGYNHSGGVKTNDFMSVDSNYPNVVAWAEKLKQRPGFQRGMKVNGWSGPAKPWLEEDKQKL